MANATGVGKRYLWGKNLNENTEVNWSMSPAIFRIRFTTLSYPRRYGVDFRFNF